MISGLRLRSSRNFRWTAPSGCSLKSATRSAYSFSIFQALVSPSRSPGPSFIYSTARCRSIGKDSEVYHFIGLFNSPVHGSASSTSRSPSRSAWPHRGVSEKFLRVSACTGSPIWAGIGGFLYKNNFKASQASPRPPMRSFAVHKAVAIVFVRVVGSFQPPPVYFLALWPAAHSPKRWR